MSAKQTETCLKVLRDTSCLSCFYACDGKRWTWGGGNGRCVVVLRFVLSQKKKGGWETQVHVGSNREVSFGGGAVGNPKRERERGRDMQGAPV